MKRPPDTAEQPAALVRERFCALYCALQSQTDLLGDNISPEMKPVTKIAFQSPAKQEDDLTAM